MEVKVRGWSRDMGTHRLVELDLPEMATSRDPNQTVWSNRPGMFRSYGQISIAWKQGLNKTGNFRMQADFTRGDIAKMFKAMFGSEIDAETLEEYGFTLADDVKKKLLGEIKLADLTLGDLAGIAAPKKETAAEEEPTPATVRLFRRRL